MQALEEAAVVAAVPSIPGRYWVSRRLSLCFDAGCGRRPDSSVLL